MKNIFLVLLSGLLLTGSCVSHKSGIQAGKNGITISEEKFSLDRILPAINSVILKKTGFDREGEAAVVHYSGPRNLDLIITGKRDESAIYYQLSVRLKDNSEWLPTDTLKIFFNTPDSLMNGLYSTLGTAVACWTRPVLFRQISNIKSGSGIQYAYWLNADSCYVAAMPLGGEGFIFSLEKEDMGFGVAGITGCRTNVSEQIPVLSFTASADFYNLFPTAFRHSFEAMGIEGNLRVKKQKPDMFNYLGWASWNAYMHDITEEKIINSARAFKKAGIPVKWFLIDDGWLDITKNKLNAYEPDRKKFPDGLSGLSSSLKKNYGINDVGVWHTLNGYWLGLNSNGGLTRMYSDTINYYDKIPWLQKSPEKLMSVNPLSTQGYSFYDEWYKYLVSQGITFVKVDNQLVVNRLADGNSTFWETGEKVFGNLHSAVNKYFGGKIINCMEMLNNDYYHYSQAAIARAVDDYNPRNKAGLYSCEFNGNAAAHVLACLHNSVWLSNIVWPDYDMFQSAERDAWYYAIAKIMSAGPVYLTDEPGKHDSSLVKSLTFNDGKVINADSPALPTEDCIFQMFSSDKPMKAFSKYGQNGLLAAWNVSDMDSVAGSFSPAQVKGLEGNRFAVFEFFGKSVSEAGLNDVIPIKAGRLSCRMFSVIQSTDDMAVIGNPDKVIPMSEISEVVIENNLIHFKANEPGTYWIYSKMKPSVFRIDSSDNGFDYSKNIISFKSEKPDAVIDVTF